MHSPRAFRRASAVLAVSTLLVAGVLGLVALLPLIAVRDVLRAEDRGRRVDDTFASAEAAARAITRTVVSEREYEYNHKYEFEHSEGALAHLATLRVEADVALAALAEGVVARAPLLRPVAEAYVAQAAAFLVQSGLRTEYVRSGGDPSVIPDAPAYFTAREATLELQGALMVIAIRMR